MRARTLAAGLIAAVAAVASLTLLPGSDPSAAPIDLQPITARATIDLDPVVPVTTPTRGTAVQVTPTVPPPTTTTSTTVPVPPAGARCPEIWTLASTAGWPDWALATVDYLAYRESRCLPHVRSTTRDTGLLQINDVHLVWLAEHGIGQPDLYDPVTNLRAGWLLFQQADRMFGCGWQPWTIRGGWSGC
jgi:soluble lytic murein transglycosylase-like protein